MLRYFPIDKPLFESTMNARAYSGPLIEIDPTTYLTDTALRSKIVESDPSYYYACLPNTETIASEATELLIDGLLKTYPDQFSLNQNIWTNRLLGEKYEILLGNMNSLSNRLSPLDWIGRQVQEDLILMQPTESEEVVCVGGHLCFAAGWSLSDKMNRSFLQIHSEVPMFNEQIGIPSDLLLRRLKPGRPVMRYNWTLAESDSLNRAPKLRDSWLWKGGEVTTENAGEKVFFRVEKQTLTRLPKTNGILFTIRTYINTVAEVVADRNRLMLFRGAVKDMPTETVRYKNATLYYDALVDYLDSLG